MTLVIVMTKCVKTPHNTNFPGNIFFLLAQMIFEVKWLEFLHLYDCTYLLHLSKWHEINLSAPYYIMYTVWKSDRCATMNKIHEEIG